MCSDLLERVLKWKDDLQVGQWSAIRSVEFIIMLNIYTSGETTIKRIIECLNLLSLVDKQRAQACKDCARDIIGLQAGKETVGLTDLQPPLLKILSVEGAGWLNDTVKNAANHFGISVDRIRYEAVDMADIDGTFDADFTSSLPLYSIAEDPPTTPLATSSETQAGNQSSDWDKINDQSDFYNRLRNFK